VTCRAINAEREGWQKLLTAKNAKKIRQEREAIEQKFTELIYTN
jgi:hypothetical protein